jgi:Rrf2 family iron-sulfur cluster assembly transcriptional regulator
VLLAIWDVAGENMRRHLAGYTLASVAAQARGEEPWPQPIDAIEPAEAIA